MTTLLRLDGSISGDGSASRPLLDAFVAAWSGDVVVRDLGAHPVPHLPQAALHWPADARPSGTAVDADAASLQDALIAEVIAADVLLIGAPMYNFGPPSTVKAWLDHLHVPGRTDPAGTEPLAGRRAVVVSTRGAVYEDDALDFGSAILRQVLVAALGLEVTVVTADATLADAVPALADFRVRKQQQADAARATLERLARELA